MRERYDKKMLKIRNEKKKTNISVLKNIFLSAKIRFIYLAHANDATDRPPGALNQFARLDLSARDGVLLSHFSPSGFTERRRYIIVISFVRLINTILLLLL